MEQLGPTPPFGPPGLLNFYQLHLPLTPALPLLEYRENAHGLLQNLGAGRSGDRITVEARFSAHLHTGPETHPASYTTGSKYCGRGMALIVHLYLGPRLKKEKSYTSTTSLGHHYLY